MKVYVAVSYLDRKEWAGDTVYGSCRNGFELCLRKLLQDEGGDTIAAHVAIYFESPSDNVRASADAFVPRAYQGYAGFFIDIVADGVHKLSVANDPSSWYQRWDHVRVELYEVAPTDVFGNALNAAAVYDRMIEYVTDQTPYDCYQNCNSVCWWPTRCSPSCGCCCPCTNGVNCIEALLVSLAAGYGASEWDAQRVLGLSPRVALGARLPSRLRDELVGSGIALEPPRVELITQGAAGLGTVPEISSVVPLLLIR
jgi:hypothetical protein